MNFCYFIQRIYKKEYLMILCDTFHKQQLPEFVFPQENEVIHSFRRSEKNNTDYLIIIGKER